MASQIKKTDLDKPWAKRAVRHSGNVKLKELKKILVVTQDKESSRNYFMTWRQRLHGASTMIRVMPIVKDPLQMVNSLAYERKRIENDIARARNVEAFRFDEVWVAFDHDSFPTFDAAVSILQSMAPQGYREAWSNECFELWYVLHAQQVSAASNIPRAALFQLCSQLCNIANYAKAGKGNLSLHTMLALKPLTEVRAAIANATVLESSMAAKCGPTTSPSQLNPLTKVHHLIDEFVSMVL